MDRVAAARERLEVVRSLAVKARDAGPPCSDCRFQTLLRTCGNPAYADFTFEPSKGRVSEAFNTPIEKARDESGLCGPEAILFEPQIVPVTVGKGIIHGSWLAFQIVGFGAAGLLFISWLLR